jgi:hypothetical protein
MIYSISLFTTATCPDVSISEQEYHHFFDSYNFFVASLDQEECFSILVENFLEFEVELLRLTTQLCFSFAQGADDLFFAKSLANRRLSNLLSSCRMYEDQTKEFYYTIFGKNVQTKAEINEFFHKEYDSRLGYRFMCALRNMSQHETLPVKGFTLHSQQIKVSPDSQISSASSLHISIDFLKQTSFKSSVIEELDGSNKDVELREMMSDYFAGLCCVQTALRSKIHVTFSESEVLLKNRLNSFIESCNPSPTDQTLGLLLSKTNEDASICTQEELFIDIIDDVKRLTKKYKADGQITKRIITNRISKN